MGVAATAIPQQPAAAALPRAGDVVISVRTPQPSAWTALAAYRPERIEWHYASDPAFVAQLKARPGVTYVGGAISANPPLPDPAGYARDFDGRIIVAPWMTWGARWATTASTGTRAALFDWAARTFATGADGLQVDDGWFEWQSEIWGAGDFSADSLAGFGPWLTRNVPAAELNELGLPGGAGFDYRAWLSSRHRVFSAADYRARRDALPSTPYWRRYLAEQVLVFWSALRERVSGPLSMNFGVVIPNETFVGLADRVDYTASELPVEDEAWKHALYGATAEAAALPFVGCFVGRAPIERLRQMIASAYAHGIVPAAPWDLFVPSEGGVTQPRFSPDPARFVDLFDFVRANRQLFDGWRSAGEIGLLVPARRYRGRDVETMVKQFVRANAPFRIVLCDSEYRAVAVGRRELDGLSSVVLAQPEADYSAASLAAVARLRTDADPARLSLGRLEDPDWRLSARRRGGARLIHVTPARFGAAPLRGSLTLTGHHGRLRAHQPGRAAVVLAPVGKTTAGSIYSLPPAPEWTILEALG